ncbi:hypothetical protein Hdeb2414_s0017g00505031 [Helianthus debilis subsp. tardiflorus]
MYSITGCMFFCEKLFRTSYVCPTQTTCRRLNLQCVCFLEVISLKKVFQTSSSWGRCGLASSSLFFLFAQLHKHKTPQKNPLLGADVDLGLLASSFSPSHTVDPLLLPFHRRPPPPLPRRHAPSSSPSICLAVAAASPSPATSLISSLLPCYFTDMFLYLQELFFFNCHDMLKNIRIVNFWFFNVSFLVFDVKEHTSFEKFPS